MSRHYPEEHVLCKTWLSNQAVEIRGLYKPGRSDLVVLM